MQFVSLVTYVGVLKLFLWLGMLGQMDISWSFLLHVCICMFLGIWCTCDPCVSMWLRVVCMPEEGIGEVMEKEDCIQALSGQIFMGMVSSQYQARLDIVRLIDGLVNACIRFVYFSLEDELKSKVSCLCWTPWTCMSPVCLESLAPVQSKVNLIQLTNGSRRYLHSNIALVCNTLACTATLKSSVCPPTGVCWEDGSWDWLELPHIFNAQRWCAWLRDPSL